MGWLRLSCPYIFRLRKKNTREDEGEAEASSIIISFSKSFVLNNDPFEILSAKLSTSNSVSQ